MLAQEDIDSFCGGYMLWRLALGRLQDSCRPRVYQLREAGFSAAQLRDDVGTSALSKVRCLE